MSSAYFNHDRSNPAFPLAAAIDDTPEKNNGKGGKADKKKLKELSESDNIAELLPEDKLEEISSNLIRDIQKDERSMSDWLKDAAEIVKLIELKRNETQYPFRKAANIKYPMVTNAVVQFASRISQEMLRDGKICKTKVIGYDPEGIKKRLGDRVCTHVNWQIMEKIPGWQNERDKLNYHLAAIGTCFTKTYFDSTEGLIISEFIPYDSMIINDQARSLDRAQRITHKIEMPKNQIIEMMRSDLFCTYDLDVVMSQLDDEDSNALNYDIWECHCWLDLDGDGMDEPYVVTLHKPSKCILRIVARYEETDIQYNKRHQVKKIFAQQYFTQYTFIPHPRGTLFGLGYGQLLLDLCSTTNTILNVMINGGHLATIQGGLISEDLRIKKGLMEVDPGEWVHAKTSMPGQKLADLVLPWNYKEPSQALFQLLQLLINTSKELTATTDIMTGNEQQTQNVSPNTVGLLMGNSLKVYTDVHSRLTRSYKSELQKIVYLNSKYCNVEEYIKLNDPSPNELKEMFIQGPDGAPKFSDYDKVNIDYDIVPVVDPNESTQQEELIKAQLIMSSGVPFAQVQGANPRGIARAYYKRIGLPIEEIATMVIPEPPPNAPPPPNPQLEKVKADKDTQDKQLQLEQQKLQIKAAEAQAIITEKTAKADKHYADAEHQAKQHNLGIVNAQIQHQASQTNAAAQMVQVKAQLQQQQVKQDHERNMAAMNHTMDLQAQQMGHQQDLTLQSHATPRSAAGAAAKNTDNTLSHLPSPEVVRQEALRRGWKPKDNN